MAAAGAAGAGKAVCGSYGLRVVMILLALGLTLYTMAPALYWHLVGVDGDVLTSTKGGVGCTPCTCDCTSGNAEAEKSTLSIAALAEGLNFTLADCLRNDPEMQEERGKSQVELLKEELKLQKEVNEDAQQRAELAYLDAKKIASQYQKEAEKCNLGMETSEEAREHAEAELVQERKRTQLWEKRARSLGWTSKVEGKLKTLSSETRTQDSRSASL